MPEKQRPNRRSTRLIGYDYSSCGAYHVTICAFDRAFLFGVIENEVMHLNSVGEVVQSTWLALPSRFSGVDLDAFVVMPNHIHSVIVLAGVSQETQIRASSTTALIPQLSSVVGAFKSLSTREAKSATGFSDRFLWQRGYHDHIIRDDRMLDGVRMYIEGNPAKWDEDSENTSRRQV